MRVSFDTSALTALGVEISAGAAEMAKAARSLVQESAMDLRDDWRKNATETAGQHGKHYPRTIQSRIGWSGLAAEIAPDAGMRQGGMSFEFGSSKQPPHLDGQRALDDNSSKFARRVAALRFLE